CSVEVKKVHVVEDDDLAVTCRPSDSTPEIGQSITWTADVDGGNGSYSYDWEGTNGLSGNTRTTTKSYPSDGTKQAIVTVKSGNQTETALCKAVVEEEEEEEDDDLVVSCRPSKSRIDEGESVVWTATVDGGTGSYSYDWSGSDNLNGSSRNVTK